MGDAVGADIVIDPLTVDPATVFEDPAGAPSFGFECSGVAAATEAALRVLRPRGVLTVTGVAAQPPFYQSADPVFKELTIWGRFIYQQEFDMAIAGPRGDRHRTTPTGVRDIDSGPETFAQMRTATDLVKVLLSPSA
jgi:threonine dehydrogenase-like Zn-dependent dehydrogenase